ncbi:MAG: hypothetical protein WBK54_00690 [Bacilli bacterium]|jgi:hypothetical protein|nr:hypothetical protein [Acholeplasmataceae bacterium]
MNNYQAKIKDLNWKIKLSKFKRDAYSLLGHSVKVRESEKAIFELETKLMKIKLDHAV